jgi:hypothetical protein
VCDQVFSDNPFDLAALTGRKLLGICARRRRYGQDYRTGGGERARNQFHDFLSL